MVPRYGPEWQRLTDMCAYGDRWSSSTQAACDVVSPDVLGGLVASVGIAFAGTLLAAVAPEAGALGAAAKGAATTAIGVGSTLGEAVARLRDRLQAGLGAAQSVSSELAISSNSAHIFRDAVGHLAEDTPANRALLQAAVRVENLVATRGPGGVIQVFRQLLPDGRQVWVEVRAGTEITNGGVNLVPRP